MLKIEIVGDDSTCYDWELFWFDIPSDWQSMDSGSEKVLEQAASKAIQSLKVLKNRLDK